MNYWTKLSIDLANQKDYLDRLFRVYPMVNNLTRELDKTVEKQLRNCFKSKNNSEMIKLLLKQKLFPIKDSYVAYLRRDKTAIERNPQTINRLAGEIYSLGIENTIKSMTLPKETNRQIGPLFKNWVKSKALGVDVTNDAKKFLGSQQNIILDMSDEQMKSFAHEHLGYTHNKGLDLVAKFNNTYVIGEAKFITDFGGHQNAQLADALATVKAKLKNVKKKVLKIAILDGVLYIQGKHKMREAIEASDELIILSALLLRPYLYSL